MRVYLKYGGGTLYLEEIIGGVQHETEHFKCKDMLNRDVIVGWLKTVAGFVNASDGEFFIGVEDITNKLISFERAAADNARDYFNNQVNEHLTPHPQMKIGFLRYEINGNERVVIHVQVTGSAVKPVIPKYKGAPSIFMQRDGFTNGATYEEIIEMSVLNKSTQYDILPSDTCYDVDDFPYASSLLRAAQ